MSIAIRRKIQPGKRKGKFGERKYKIKSVDQEGHRDRHQGIKEVHFLWVSEVTLGIFGVQF
jgi:hypothetical protein